MAPTIQWESRSHSHTHMRFSPRHKLITFPKPLCLVHVDVKCTDWTRVHTTVPLERRTWHVESNQLHRGAWVDHFGHKNRVWCQRHPKVPGSKRSAGRMHREGVYLTDAKWTPYQTLVNASLSALRSPLSALRSPLSALRSYFLIFLFFPL